MYCSHCGYYLKEEEVQKGLLKPTATRNKDTAITYVCPRCGHIIKNNLSDDEIKDLSRAAHAELHRSSNLRNTGMCFLMITIILLAISFMFFLMSFKASKGGQFDTTCTEFYVFVVLLILGIGSACYSTYNLVYGFKKKKRYSILLKDIQDGIFYQ